MIRKEFLLSALIVLLSLAGFAQTRKYTNEFLAIGVGARALAMGNATIAATDDVTSGYWNPAGLSRLENNLQIGLQHSEYFSGIANYDYAGVAIKIDEKSHFALNAMRFGVDDIPNTLDLIDEDGAINYDRVSAFSAVDYGFFLSYARIIGDRGLRIGGSAKVIHKSIGTFAKAWGFGIDLGLQKKFGNFNVGLTGRDISTTYNTWAFSFTEKEKEVLSRTGNLIPVKSVEVALPSVIAGVNYLWEISEKFTFLPEADLIVTFDGRRNALIESKDISVNPAVGFEFGMFDIVYLRGGVNEFQKKVLISNAYSDESTTLFRPNAGIGLKFNVIHIDYAISSDNNNSNSLFTHVFSLKFDIRKGMFSEKDNPGIDE